MKHLKHLLTALLLLCTTIATAHDFEVDGIYYKIIKTSYKTVEVTYWGTDFYDYYNKYIGRVVIPESVIFNGTTYSVTSIGSNAFAYCTRLTSITIPNSVTSIGESAFEDCKGLTSITIPNSVTSIVNYAFSGCTGLTSITIPNSVTSIESKAFYYCTGLTSITIPNSVKSIGNHAFDDCTGLTSITIPNSVTSIGDFAFDGCTGLTSITIPNSVTSIGESAFYNCTGLKTVINFSNLTFSKGSGSNGFVAYYATKVINAPNAVINGDFIWCKLNGANTLACYLGEVAELTLPADYNDGNYVIGNDAFLGCTGLTSITIPNSVTNIGRYAFYNCTGLTNIEIPNSVTSIGWRAFSGCSNLETLYISNTIESIGDYAFAECNNIFDIKIGSKKAITASENIFSSDAYINACLYVPTGRKDFYAKTSPWSNFIISEMDFTGIDDVKAENGQVEGVYYDLSGRAVENPTSGVYIINGKKVLIK